MYRLVNNNSDQKISFIQRLTDLAHIPMVDNNADYQEYKRWLKQGNKPEEAVQINLSMPVTAPLWKIKIVLNKTKKLDKFEDFINKKNDVELSLFWNNATSINSNSTYFNDICSGLKMNQADIDKLFEDANNLQV